MDFLKSFSWIPVTIQTNYKFKNLQTVLAIIVMVVGYYLTKYVHAQELYAIALVLLIFGMWFGKIQFLEAMRARWRDDFSVFVVTFVSNTVFGMGLYIAVQVLTFIINLI